MSPSSIQILTPTKDRSKGAARHISLPLLSAHPSKLLLIGSLFGSGRIPNQSRALLKSLDKRIAFINPWLLKPARESRNRLGGGSSSVGRGYLACHVRIGDGAFRRKKWENVGKSWEGVVRKVGVEDSVWTKVWKEVGWEKGRRGELGLDAIVEETGREREVVKRGAEVESIWGQELWDEDEDVVSVVEEEEEAAQHLRFQKRTSSSSRPSPSSIILQSLTCRGRLHTSPPLLPFNTPNHLATDSPDPTKSHFVAIFQRISLYIHSL